MLNSYTIYDNVHFLYRATTIVDPQRLLCTSVYCIRDRKQATIRFERVRVSKRERADTNQIRISI